MTSKMGSLIAKLVRLGNYLEGSKIVKIVGRHLWTVPYCSFPRQNVLLRRQHHEMRYSLVNDRYVFKRKCGQISINLYLTEFLNTRLVVANSLHHVASCCFSVKGLIFLTPHQHRSKRKEFPHVPWCHPHPTFQKFKIQTLALIQSEFPRPIFCI